MALTVETIGPLLKDDGDGHLVELTEDDLRGPQGDAGEGVPTGGSTGQVLGKDSGTNFDTSWVTIPADAAAATASMRTLGTGAAQAAAGDDARLSDQRVPTDGSVTNAKVAAGAAIAESKLNLASDAAAGTASRRTLGTGATQACAGNDARLSDQRTPSDDSVTNAKVAAGAAIAESKLNLASDAAAGTASRRTLGTGATQACAGNDSRLSDTRTPTDGTVTNAKVAAGAAIARSKLDFGSGLVNADIAAAAAIAQSKLVMTNIKGYVNHGSTAGTARPSGFGSIEWIGSVEPTNAIDGDTWVNTAP